MMPPQHSRRSIAPDWYGSGYARSSGSGSASPGSGMVWPPTGRYTPDMQSVADFVRKMRILEQLACPTEADRPFFNAHIQDLGPYSSYRENLENLVRLRSGGAD